jgi:hypothetical protein
MIVLRRTRKQLGSTLGAALLILGVSGHAKAETYTTYRCAFSVPGMGKDKIEGIVAIGADGKAFTVDFERKTQKPFRIPVAVRQARGTDRLYSFTVDNPGQEDVGIQKIDFILRIPTEGGKSRISVRARRFSGNPSGSGTCTRKDRDTLNF